jgi:rod shape-determining protein MreC
MQSLTRRVWQRTEVAMLAACLVFAAVLMLLPASAKEAVGRAVVATVFAPLEKPLAQFRSLVQSRRENLELRQSLASISLENASLRQAAAENAQLREMLGLRERWQWSLAAAEVSSRQPGIFAPDLVIDKGAAAGLSKGMVAVSTMGLVGKLSGIEDGSSVVQTLFHPDFRVSALDLRSRVLGIMRYQTGSGMVLDRVPLHSDIKAGDTLVSSGYGGVMPYGLMLATVESARPDPLRLRLDVKIIPSLDLNRLSQLFVVTGGAPTPLPSLSTASSDTMGPAPRARRPAVVRPSLSIRPVQPPDEDGQEER